MYCSHCGADLPFSGKTCPYCGTDKQNYKNQVIKYATLAVGGALFVAVVVAKWPHVRGFGDFAWGILLAMLLGGLSAGATAAYFVFVKR